jgi:hypothetical protein
MFRETFGEWLTIFNPAGWYKPATKPKNPNPIAAIVNVVAKYSQTDEIINPMK